MTETSHGDSGTEQPDGDNAATGAAPFDGADIERHRVQIETRAAHLKERMTTAGGGDVAVLAVCKGHPVEAALAARAVGLTTLGENYAQDLRAKAEIVCAAAGAPVRWHFIGQLQTNKVRLIADHVAVWQSVDRPKVGREIAKRAPGATVFAQVNLSSEPQKAGCGFDELGGLLDELAGLDLHVGGLMGVGTASDEIATASGFARLRSEVDRLGLEHCSMGMTVDLELAIREGSTMVRVGTDLFGPRP